jgi:hypothetical protein
MEIPNVGIVEFPGDMDMAEIERQAARLYKEQQEQQPAAAATPSFGQRFAQNLRDSPPAQLTLGAAKGVGQIAVDLARLGAKIPGVEAYSDALAGEQGATQQRLTRADEVLQPSSVMQSIGKGGAQIAAIAAPAGAIRAAGTAATTRLAPYVGRVAANVIGRGGAEAIGGAALTAAAGGDPTTGAVFGATVPIAGRVGQAVSQRLTKAAELLVRAAIKPTVTAMRRVAGASFTGIDAKAQELVRFIIDNRLTTPEKAQAILADAERRLQRALAIRNAPTDAALRAQHYLDALEASAAKQGMPGKDVAQIRAAGRQLLQGPMGETVGMTPTGQPIRALRQSVPAKEALESARASSKWRTDKQWGELKTVEIEARKKVEQAQRDAVKDAVPEARSHLARESQAITAKEVLDRMAFRQASRDAVSLPAHVIAAAEIATGRVPVLSMAANWLRNNQMKAGIWADDLSKALAAQNKQKVMEIMERIVAVEAATALGGQTP